LTFRKKEKKDHRTLQVLPSEEHGIISSLFVLHNSTERMESKEEDMQHRSIVGQLNDLLTSP
jgi:hypothetical protein